MRVRRRTERRMEFNPKDYLHHIESLEMDEAEKLALIASLWRIAQCFVDDAFGTATITNADNYAERFTSAANDNDSTKDEQGAA